MTDQVHPQRETYPLITADDHLVMVFRNHIPVGWEPYLYLQGMTEVELRVDTSRTLDDRAGLVVLNYTVGAGNKVTITVNAGTPVVLTEGASFDAIVSNNETAIQISAAINTAALGLTASYVEGEPNVYVVPTPGAGITAFTIVSDDVLAWDHRILATIGPLVTFGNGHKTEIELPSGSGTTDPTKQVAFLRIFRGRVSADLRSPVEVRTYFQQPATLRATTGHPGGWPTTP
jgi:hypothetical protein